MEIEWVVSTVTGRVSDGKVTEAHWRYGNAYGSVDVSGTAADDFVALVKTAFGAERVALIEAQEALRFAKQAAPETITVAPDKLADAIKAKPDQATLDAVVQAAAAVEVAEAARVVKEEAERAAKQAEVEAAQANLKGIKPGNP